MRFGERPFECACGRKTNRPEIVRGVLWCEECAFDQEYGVHTPAKTQRTAQDFTAPRFRVRRVS